jgi:hypothetical protein
LVFDLFLLKGMAAFSRKILSMYPTRIVLHVA